MDFQIFHAFVYVAFAFLLCVLSNQKIFGQNFFAQFRSSTTRPENAANSDEIVVRLSIGQIVGRKIEISGLAWTPHRDWRDFQAEKVVSNLNYIPTNVTTPIYTFLGVPYAQKPVGNLRFKPPQKLDRLPDEFFAAKKFQPACAQDITQRPTLQPETQIFEYSVDEDCLFLNVFSPEASMAAARTFPVIVFFHGGNFQMGSANDWPGHILASKGVVVVTANYRLGAFGFLSLGGREANYGLLDQRLVLEWVRENILAFAGDRDRISVVGHGAGAVSAGLHMLSPGSAGLMSSVAALSGSHLSYHQVITQPMLAYNNTVKLGRMVGCYSSNVGDIIECLKTRSTDDIIAGTKDLLVEYNQFAFLPTVDKNFLPDAPLNLLKRRQVASPVNFLTGINLHDGANVLLSDRFLAKSGFTVNQQYVDRFVFDYVLKRNYTTNREATMHAIKFLYTFWPDIRNDEKIRQQFVEMATDAYYASPVSLAAQLHSESGSVVFMYVNAYNFSTGALNPGQHFLPPWMSICHECDLYLLFGFPWMPRYILPSHLRKINWTDHDKNASEIFMAIFKKYAETKNPNLQFDAIWQNYGPRDHFYLLFNLTRTLLQNYDWEHVAFWNIYIDQLADFFTTTFSPVVVGIRRQLLRYKISTGVLVILISLCFVLCGTLAYFLVEKNKRRKWRQVQRQLDSQTLPSFHHQGSSTTTFVALDRSSENSRKIA